MTIRQYSLMELFARERGFSIEQALRFQQTTFGSLCRRKWVRFNAKSQKFETTPAGREIFQVYRTLDFYRKHDSQKFSVFVHLPQKRLQIVHTNAA